MRLILLKFQQLTLSNPWKYMLIVLDILVVFWFALIQQMLKLEDEQATKKGSPVAVS